MDVMHSAEPHGSANEELRPATGGGLSKLDQFAEHLAEGASVTEAGARIGWGMSHANAMLQRLRAKLGPQAI